MTYLGEGVVLVAPEWIDVNLPRGYTRLDVPPGESAAANVLRVNQMLLHPAGAPKTAALLSQFAGKNKVKLRELPISEAQKGDGALTCQSLLW
jgi:dimethylargininase